MESFRRRVLEFYFVTCLFLTLVRGNNNPGQRFGHSITVDNDGNVLLFGGEYPNGDGDVLSLSLSRLGAAIRRKTDSLFSFVFVAGYTYDGFRHVNRYQTWDYTNGLRNDLWLFNTTTSQWSALGNDPGAIKPSPRAFHASSYSQGKLYVHGGNDVMYGNNQRGGTSVMKLCGSGDLWTFDMGTLFQARAP